MTGATQISYAERLDRVTTHIYDHLDDDIDLFRLAEVARLSPCHWHRIYQAMTGETIAATVKRLRLHRAAGDLAQTAMPVAAIAARSGYPNVQSFTRIFKSVYGMPPARYRREGAHSRFQLRTTKGQLAMHTVTIKDLPALKAIAVSHTGPYMQIGKAFETLFGQLWARGLRQSGCRMIAVYLDDPTSVAGEKLRSKAAVISDAAPGAPPLEACQVSGGPHAVLRFQGPYSGLAAVYQWLYGTWLPQSGREAADAPVYEEYLNNPRDTPPAELLTDICLPLK